LEKLITFSIFVSNNQIFNSMKTGNQNRLLFIILTTLLIAIGCKKELPPPNQEPTPENPLEIVVSNTFDWKTTRDITLEVTGLNIPVSIRNTLMVKSPDEEKVYLKNQLFMNQNYTLMFTIPSYETEVLVTYGSIRKTLEVTTDIIHFNFIAQ